MDPTDTFKLFLKDLQSLDPQYPSEFDTNSVANEVESFYNNITQIIQKDDTFFSTERILFGRDLSLLYSPDTKDMIWKNMHMSTLSSFFHGDIKEKISTLMTTAKTLWSSSGQTNDEVDRLLNDEKTGDYFEEMLEYVQNLRTSKVILEILEEIDISSLGVSLDNPADLINMVRDPEHPTIKKTIATVQRLLRNKLERGQFTQHQLMSDIEGIKAKVQSLFGGIMNEFMGLGGRREDGPSASIMMSNNPEARRQRMLARLQRKQREKTQR